ncbi:MAG: preprotein translocase subunit YajC [Pontiellaceae bacterium]|tara:strand:+ start:203 stop:529 length:327 start_codon:yes stop_codon:yes gene_type:complete
MNQLSFVLSNTAPSQNPLGMFVPMILLFAIMYVLLIRPQKRREKERKNMLSEVKTADKVLMTSGIIGYVTNVKENTIIIRIADNTKIEAVRASISKILAPDEVPSEPV